MLGIAENLSFVGNGLAGWMFHEIVGPTYSQVQKGGDNEVHMHMQLQQRA
jgi:hypothetical protein